MRRPRGTKKSPRPRESGRPAAQPLYYLARTGRCTTEAGEPYGLPDRGSLAEISRLSTCSKSSALSGGLSEASSGCFNLWSCAAGTSPSGRGFLSCIELPAESPSRSRQHTISPPEYPEARSNSGRLAQCASFWLAENRLRRHAKCPRRESGINMLQALRMPSGRSARPEREHDREIAARLSIV